MKNRLLAVFLAVIVAFGCIGVRPQKAYANVGLAVQGYEILYGMLAAMGAIAVVGGSDSDKRSAVESFWGDIDVSGQNAFNAIVSSGELVGDSLWRLGSSFNRSDWVAFYDSVVSTLTGYYRFKPTVGLGSDASSLPVVSSTTDVVMNRVGVAGDAFFCIASGSYVDCNVLIGGYYLQYTYNLKTGVFVQKRLVDVGHGATMEFGVGRSGGDSEKGFFSALIKNSSGSAVSGPVGGISFNDSSGCIFGSSDDTSMYGYVSPLSLSYVLGVDIGTSELLDCDSWVNRWEDASSEADKRQIGIITGKDLTGYDTVSDVYAPDTGLVTGLDTPTIDVPVTPDLTGIAGGLKSILDWLKALPATLVKAFLGNPDLNFDALRNNSFSTKFPFCIPFDLYNCIKQLVSTPVPPVFTLSFDGTIMESAGDIVIDMSKFETLAKIIRFFVFFGVVLGLIKITRNLIKG